MMMNVSLDTANITTINVSTLDLRIWQHFNSNWTKPHLQKVANVTEIPVAQLYKHMIKASEPVHSFTIKDDDKDPSLIWTILTYPGAYIGTICTFSLYVWVSIAFKRFWFKPAIPKCQPYSPVSMQHAIMEYDVEVAPIYRSGGMVEDPRRLCKNHDLCIE